MSKVGVEEHTPTTACELCLLSFNPYQQNRALKGISQTGPSTVDHLETHPNFSQILGKSPRERALRFLIDMQEHRNRGGDVKTLFRITLSVQRNSMRILGRFV